MSLSHSGQALDHTSLVLASDEVRTQIRRVYLESSCQFNLTLLCVLRQVCVSYCLPCFVGQNKFFGYCLKITDWKLKHRKEQQARGKVQENSGSSQSRSSADRCQGHGQGHCQQESGMTAEVTEPGD